MPRVRLLLAGLVFLMGACTPVATVEFTASSQPPAEGQAARIAVLHQADTADPADPWLDSLADLAARMPATLPRYTVEAVPTSVPSGLDVETLRTGAPWFHDDFGVDDGHWSPLDPDMITCTYLDGAYVLAAEHNLRGMCIRDGVVADFLVEVDVAHVAGAEAGYAAGIVFRYRDSDHYYRLELMPDGALLLLKRVAGVTTTLLDRTTAAQPATDGAFRHRLAILADGGQLTPMLDGVALPPIEDDGLDQGRLGLFVRAPQGVANPGDVALAFDNFTAWVLTVTPQAMPTHPAPAATVLPIVPPAATPISIETLPIDWQPLLEEFDVANQRVEEVFESTMAVPALFVVFEFEAVRDVGQVSYTVAFVNAQAKVRAVASVDFRPDPALPGALYDTLGGWNAGVRGTARFALPEDLTQIVTIRLVRVR